jgi:hypothetical protein
MLDANYEFKDGSHNAQPVRESRSAIHRIFMKSAGSSYATFTGRVVESRSRKLEQKKPTRLAVRWAAFEPVVKRWAPSEIL